MKIEKKNPNKKIGSENVVKFQKYSLFNKLLKKSLHLHGVVVMLLIYVQHRFLLFRNIYEHFSTHMGSGGDAYYNLSIFMQNALNISNNNFYSLEGDHYTWYQSIIGITSHNYSASGVFYLLNQVTDNYILIFNSIFFGNLFLMQLGLYFLIRYYTKNYFLGILGALLFPLSFAFQTFYVSHIHASYYASFPFLLLFMEQYFEKLPKIQIGRLIAIFSCVVLLVLADWHVAIFSSLFLIPYALYKLYNVKKVLIEHPRKTILPIVVLAVCVIAVVAPLAAGYLKSSENYNSIRTLSDISGTNFSTLDFLGFQQIVFPLLNTIKTIFPDSSIYIEALFRRYPTMPFLSYPDFLTITLFWILNLIILPLTIVFAKKRKFPQLLFFCWMFLVLCWISIGPFAKVGHRVLYSIKLPHYYLTQLFFPLNAIRAVWRMAIVYWFLGLIIYSMVTNTLLVHLSKKTYKNYVYFVFGIVSIGLYLFMQNGYQGGLIEHTTIDSRVLDYLNTQSTQKGAIDVYVLPSNKNEQDKLGYEISKLNLEHKSRDINWVAGGIAGVYPYNTALLEANISSNTLVDQSIKILYSKDVDVLVHFDNKNIEYTQVLEQYYSLDQKYDDISTYVIKPNIQIEGVTNTPLYTMNQSNHSLKNTRYITINIEAKNDIYTNPYTSKLDDYTLEFKNESGDVYTEDIELTKPPFLFASTGITRTIESKKRLKPGNYTVTLKEQNNENILAFDEFKVHTTSDYKTLLNKQNLEYTSETSDYMPYKDEKRIIPIHVNATITKGTIVNNTSNPLHTNSVFKSQFVNDDGINYGFPPYINQADCPLNGTYLEGDTIDIWCFQHPPVDKSFTKVRSQIVTTNTPWYD
jgi:hypothetical protein